MTIPHLYVLAISHYCEKARWALDVLGVDYALEYPLVGEHIALARSWGLASSSMPILQVGDEIVQGSSAVIDWADEKGVLDVEASQSAEGRTLEQRLDDVVGVHVRRLYYSEALIDDSDSVLRIFAHHLDPEKREMLEARWGVVRDVMIEQLDLGAGQRAESLAIVEAELDYLDGIVGDGRAYLLGDRLSRVDITAASLLSPIVLPEEHPTYALVDLPPQARADVDRWSGRPAVVWARELYRKHR
jgi:glutathione S-transferase